MFAVRVLRKYFPRDASACQVISICSQYAARGSSEHGAPPGRSALALRRAIAMPSISARRGGPGRPMPEDAGEYTFRKSGTMSSDRAQGNVAETAR